MTQNSNSESAQAYRRHKRTWLLTIIVTGCLGGASAAYFGLHRRHDPFEAVLIVLYLFLIFGWYHADAEARGFRRGWGMNFLVVAAAVIGIPVYLFRTRGFARGLLAVGLMLLMFVAFLVSTMIGAFVVALSLGMPA